MKLTILTLLLVAVVKLLSCEQPVEEWEIYKNTYNKKYDDVEEYLRKLIWENNVKYIQSHNLGYDLGEHSYFLGINDFADMTNEEFKARYLGFKKRVGRNNTARFMTPMNMEELPPTVNWVTKGYVTPVKNQGQCGSCWAFSTTGSLEGQYFRANNNLVSFSEQQLVDCSQANGNSGCNGGLMDDAFNYIEQNGIESEDSYPYTAQEGSCQYDSNAVVTRISGFVDVDHGDEVALASAVATQGPISVAIDASHRSFQLYKGGVYNEEGCSSDHLDHGVLVVGYGKQIQQKYWLVKNSWGGGWGMGGYIKMSKDRNNQCGIASMASYPTM